MVSFKGLYTGEEHVDSNVISIWINQFSNYNSPSIYDNKENEYLLQEIEVDAVFFANNQWKVIVEEKDLIPKKLITHIAEEKL